MKLLRFLLRHGRGLMWLTAGAAAFSGACNAGLIAVVNRALTDASSTAAMLVTGFVLLGLGKLGSSALSQVLLARFAQGATARLRQELARKVLGVPLRTLERIGAPRVMVALTEDIVSLSNAMMAVPTSAVNLAMLVGGGIYLGLLSWKALVIMTVFVATGAVVYRLLFEKAHRCLRAAREAEDALYGHFRALTEGIKELKLHRERRGVFLAEHVQSAAQTYARHNVLAEHNFITAQNWSQFLFLMVIGVILFLFRGTAHFSQEALFGYVLTTLYLMGPLAGLLNSFGVFWRASIALNKIEALGVEMTASGENCPVTPAAKPTGFERLELIGVTHAYQHDHEDSHFTLGPIDLTFRPGQLTFIVGGNGSGKSTLAKIVTGLYPPEAGEIRWNGQLVTDANRDDCRQLFSAVFADFYLFDSFVGLNGNGLDERARQFLHQFQLSNKVKVVNHRLTTTALSQGQRKRLALLTAYLEDRPFYVFDEWASDQDPQFKEVFYTQLLPELKQRGKTVLVITHDDRFFHVADRVIKLDYGKMALPEDLIVA